MTFDASDVVRLLWQIIGCVLVLVLWVTVSINKTTKARIGWSLFVLVVFSAGLWGLYYKLVQHPRQIAEQERKKAGLPSDQEYKERYAKAKALFDERCKTAGEKVYRTIEGVEGVLLENVRPDDDRLKNRANPNWADAGLPDEAGGDWYIRNFLGWEHRQFAQQRGYLNSHPTNQNGFTVYPGYQFVDVREKKDAIERYRFKKPPESDLVHAPVEGNHARYAVEYRNMTDPIDRALWVAGTVVTITDTQTNQILAEKTWYSLEPGQGSTAGFRSPWGFAITCPSLTGWRGGATRMFVDQVLKPKKED